MSAGHQTTTGPLPIGQFARLVQQTVKNDPLFQHQALQGEVSSWSVHNGNIYFTLRDDDGQMDCVIWRSARLTVSPSIKVGSEVIIIGSVDVWPSEESCRSLLHGFSRYRPWVPWRRQNANSSRHSGLKVHWTFPLAACRCCQSTWRSSPKPIQRPCPTCVNSWPTVGRPANNRHRGAGSGRTRCQRNRTRTGRNPSLSPSRGGESARPTAGGRRHRGTRRRLARGPLGIQFGTGRAGHPRQHRPHHLSGGS